MAIKQPEEIWGFKEQGEVQQYVHLLNFLSLRLLGFFIYVASNPYFDSGFIPTNHSFLSRSLALALPPSWMESYTCAPFRNLHRYARSWNVQGRLLRMLNIQKTKKGRNEYYLWRMAFMDEELDEIEVFVYDEDIKQFQCLMHEGQIYRISNVMVYENESDSRLVRNDLKIILKAQSKIELCTSDISRTPLYKYNFVYLNRVNSFLEQKKYLFDVIVMVMYVGPICEKKIANNRDVLKRDLNVLDHCLKPMTITLWGKLSEIEGDWLQQNIASNPILLASGVQASNYKGLAITTFEHGKLKINPSITEAEKLNAWMKTNMQAQRIIQRAATCEEKADILFNATQINFAELHEIKPNQPKKITYYRITATIWEINKDRLLWYTACMSCNKQVQWREEHPYCEHCCIEKPKTISRYILRVKVKDFSGETRFTIFDKNAEFLLGVAANKLQLIRMQDDGDRILNDIICSIMMKSYTFLISSDFKISVLGDEGGYVIFSIHDADYIEESYDMLREIEKTDNDHKRKKNTPS